MHVSKSVTRATWHKPCSASPHSRNPRQLEATRPSTGPAKHFTGQGLTITLSPSDARTQMSSTDSFLLDQSLFVLCRSFQRWGYKGEPECCSAILISKQGFWSSSIYLSPNHCLKYGVHPPGTGRACPVCSLACSKQSRGPCEAWHGDREARRHCR